MSNYFMKACHQATLDAMRCRSLNILTCFCRVGLACEKSYEQIQLFLCCTRVKILFSSWSCNRPAGIFPFLLGNPVFSSGEGRNPLPSSPRPDKGFPACSSRLSNAPRRSLLWRGGPFAQEQSPVLSAVSQPMQPMQKNTWWRRPCSWHPCLPPSLPPPAMTTESPLETL